MSCCTRRDRSDAGSTPCADVTNTKAGGLGLWLWCSNCLMEALAKERAAHVETKAQRDEARGEAQSLRHSFAEYLTDLRPDLPPAQPEQLPWDTQ